MIDFYETPERQNNIASLATLLCGIGGIVLFAAAKVGRFLGHDSEEALHGTCEKFITRFCRVEEQLGGTPMKEVPLERLEQLWKNAKAREP